MSKHKKINKIDNKPTNRREIDKSTKKKGDKRKKEKKKKRQ